MVVLRLLALCEDVTSGVFDGLNERVEVESKRCKGALTESLGNGGKHEQQVDTSRSSQPPHPTELTVITEA